VIISLQGINDRGQVVNLQQTTGADGRYEFTNLRPGTYNVVQGVAAGLLPGKINAAGNLGGQAVANRFNSISVTPGAAGDGYNFGWLKPATITGFVYADQNRSGQFDSGDRGVMGTWVLLTGTDDRGAQVRQVAWTAVTGAYAFTNLRPGVYTISHVAIPQGWRRSAVNLGSLGGIQSNDAASSVALGVGDFGRDYNFGIFALSNGVGKGNFLGSYWR